MTAAKAIRRPARDSARQRQAAHGTGITRWERFDQIGRVPERIIVCLHGGFQTRTAGKRKTRVLEWLRTSADFDAIGEATRSIMLYPRAVRGDWKTGNRTYIPQAQAIELKIALVEESLPKLLPVGFVGFSDGGTMAHICANRLAADFAVIYSAPIRQWDAITPPPKISRYLLIRNATEKVASEAWRQDFVDWCERNRVPYDKFNGHVEPFGALGWKHRWDTDLNESIAAWINANS